MNGAVNVQQIMLEIRRKVRAIHRLNDDATRRARRAISTELMSHAARLSARVGTIQAGVGRIGAMPPQPPTLRGKIGGVLVHVMQRALFWLVPSLQSAHEQVAQALADQVKINEELLKAVVAAHARIEQMQPPDAPVPSPGLPASEEN